MNPKFRKQNILSVDALQLLLHWFCILYHQLCHSFIDSMIFHSMHFQVVFSACVLTHLAFVRNFVVYIHEVTISCRLVGKSVLAHGTHQVVIHVSSEYYGPLTLQMHASRCGIQWGLPTGMSNSTCTLICTNFEYTELNIEWKKLNWEKCVQNNPKLILQFLKNKITTRIAVYTKSPTKSTTFSRRPRIKSDSCSDFIFQNKRSHFAFFTLFLKFGC